MQKNQFTASLKQSQVNAFCVICQVTGRALDVIRSVTRPALDVIRSVTGRALDITRSVTGRVLDDALVICWSAWSSVIPSYLPSPL